MGTNATLRLWATLLGLFWGSWAFGSSLTLSTDAPAGSPLALPAGSVAGQVIVRVFNDTAADLVADTMTAWQVRLVIVADPGATGTVTFTSPATGSAPNPSGYVFGANGLGILVTNATSQLDANDLRDGSGTGGTQVPISPGASLLAIGLSSSANATGTFGLFAVEGANATLWTDNAAAPQTRYFVNVPNSGGLVRIGNIDIPEPGMAGVLMLSIAGLGLGRGRGRSRLGA